MLFRSGVEEEVGRLQFELVGDDVSGDSRVEPGDSGTRHVLKLKDEGAAGCRPGGNQVAVGAAKHGGVQSNPVEDGHRRSDLAGPGAFALERRVRDDFEAELSGRDELLDGAVCPSEDSPSAVRRS